MMCESVLKSFIKLLQLQPQKLKMGALSSLPTAWFISLFVCMPKPNRDRFVLSNGHGCALQYTFLHLLGYKLSLDDLKHV